MSATCQTFGLIESELARYHELDADDAAGCGQYRLEPARYVQERLGVELHAQQQQIARALIEHKRVLVQAGNGPGKTFVAASLVNWFYDCYSPGITLTTAPTQPQVEDLLWKEIRMLRRDKSGFQPRAPRLADADNHFAVGYTARDYNAFQGRHERNLFLVFDEATGIDAQFWDAGEGMMTSDNCYWLVLLNPTDITSYAYEAALAGKFHVITLSAFEHPNILAELEGRPAPYPAAVRLKWVEERINEWCSPIQSQDATATDFEWKGQWYRPGALFESRVMGRWPSQSVDSVWADAYWQDAVTPKPELQAASKQYPPEIGCDRARFGDDFTAIHIRRGGVSLHHESANGWDTARTLARLKELASEWAARCDVAAKKVLVKVDDFQGGVVDAARADEWNFVDINSASTAIDAEGYPNRRSELWFVTADRAKGRELDLSGLPQSVIAELRRQLLAPKWSPDSRNRRVVEPKEKTKKRLKRSPDDADALNLAYAASRVIESEDSDSPLADALMGRGL